MKKKILSLILVSALFVTSIFVSDIQEAEAASCLDEGNSISSTAGAVSEGMGVNFDPANIIHSGDVGGIKWGIDRNGVFAFYHSDATPQKRISGASAFPVCESASEVPWYPYRSQIKYVTMANLDSFLFINIMDYYFCDCKNLIGVVMLPVIATSMNSTFKGDTSLQFVGCAMPRTRTMNSCFYGCTSLSRDVVFGNNPDECKNAFYNVPGKVVVVPEIYDTNSKLALESNCSRYLRANSGSGTTLYGISRTAGELISDYMSEPCVSSIRYGQKLSDVEIGSTGGLRYAYSCGDTNFKHSVYVPCSVKRVVKTSYNESEILDAGIYPDMIDVQMKPVLSDVFSEICMSDFYGSKYESLTVEKCPLEMCECSISVDAFTYDGSEKKPEFTLRNPYSGTKLVKGKDYTVVYQNNTNAGTATAAITGVGNYTGSIKRNYTIGNADLSGGVAGNGYSGTYDGNAHGIQVTVKNPSSGVTIRYGTSAGKYTLTSSPSYRDVGTYTVYYQVSAENYNTYTGSAIVHIEPKDIKNCSVQQIANGIYNGKLHTPVPVVTDGEKRLTQDKDYSVSYSNNKNAGTATVTISGKGNYTGSKSVTFSIEPLRLQNSNDDADGFLSHGSVVYSGEVQSPELSVLIGGGRISLKEGVDYVVSNHTDTQVGLAKATISGKGNFQGVVNISYVITAFPMQGLGEKMVLEKEEFFYTGEEIHPAVTIRDHADRVLTEGKDYTLVYTDAVGVGAARVEAVFQGNYMGSITKSFYIVPAVVTDVILSEEGFVYNGTEHRPEARGYREGTDYQVTYRENTEVGKALAIFSFQGNYTGTVTKEFEICPKNMKDELVFPQSTEIEYKDGLTVSASALTTEENLYGSFGWQNPDELVQVKNKGYAVRFVPRDLKNYDWSSVDGWDEKEQMVIRTVPLTVRKAAGVRPEFTVACLAEGEALAVSEITNNSTAGRLCWSNGKVLASCGVLEYSMDFIPQDKDNYDWTKVGQWDEEHGICQFMCRLVVIENPEASYVNVGERLSSSVLSSGQKGAAYEWEEPDQIVTKKNFPENRYRVIYRYQGQQITREVIVPVRENPEETNPTYEPGNAEDPSAGTELSGQEDGLSEEEYQKPNAFELIERFISTNLNTSDKSKNKNEIYAVKKQTGSVNSVRSFKKKIKVKWLKKRKTKLEMKKGRKWKLRIKGVSAKKKVIWHSCLRKVVSVSAKGVIRARKKGTARILARVGNKRYVCRITVKK